MLIAQGISEMMKKRPFIALSGFVVSITYAITFTHIAVRPWDWTNASWEQRARYYEHLLHIICGLIAPSTAIGTLFCAVLFLMLRKSDQSNSAQNQPLSIKPSER